MINKKAKLPAFVCLFNFNNQESWKLITNLIYANVNIKLLCKLQRLNFEYFIFFVNKLIASFF